MYLLTTTAHKQMAAITDHQARVIQENLEGVTIDPIHGTIMGWQRARIWNQVAVRLDPMGDSEMDIALRNCTVFDQDEGR